MAAVDWWETQSFPAALALALVATVCWGSWTNTAKAVAGRVNFVHFYHDYCVGTVVMALFCWAVPGRFIIGHDGVDLANIFFASAAGAVFGVANMMLTTGIALVGLSIAFPLCVGTALVLGTVLTYVVDPRGRPDMIFSGVALALLGVVVNAKAYGFLERHRQECRTSSGKTADGEANSPAMSKTTIGKATSDARASDADGEATPAATPTGAGTFRNILMCIVAGVLLGCWSPLSARSVKGEAGLSPYFSIVCFTVASWIVGLSISMGQQHGCALMPLVDPPTSVREYFKIPIALHAWGLLGGIVWSTGTVANFVSGGPLGPALSYALGMTAPLVAVLWGLGWYHEFDGAPKAAKGLVALMFVLFIGAISLLCASKT